MLSMSFSLVRIENIEFGMMNSLIIGLAGAGVYGGADPFYIQRIRIQTS